MTTFYFYLKEFLYYIIMPIYSSFFCIGYLKQLHVDALISWHSQLYVILILVYHCFQTKVTGFYTEKNCLIYHKYQSYILTNQQHFNLLAIPSESAIPLLFRLCKLIKKLAQLLGIIEICALKNHNPVQQSSLGYFQCVKYSVI